MGSVRQVGGYWFGCAWGKTLGPYRTETEARRAMRRQWVVERTPEKDDRRIA